MVRTTSGAYLVMDLQFQPWPVLLESYLAQIEVRQPLRPAWNLDEMAGTCYWTYKSKLHLIVVIPNLKPSMQIHANQKSYRKIRHLHTIKFFDKSSDDVKMTEQ